VNRLQFVLDEKGWSPRGWSIKAGLKPDAVRQILNGRSLSPRVSTLQKLAHEAGRTVDWLQGKGDDEELAASFDAPSVSPRGPANSIALIGHIGAGDQVYHFGIGEARETVDAPPGVSRGLAAQVRGASMYPVYRDGDLVVGAEHQGRIEDLIGMDCFVQVHDGPLYLKVLRKGTRGRFHLESYNSSVPLIKDQAVEWAAPVAWVRRRQR
jgi:phage repressor protein C with HTH and peptisase S24 domain